MTKTKNNITAEEILFKNIKELINISRKSVANNINYTILFTYFHIGKYLIEDEQKGEKRAEYSKNILKDLSKKLLLEFGKGFSVDNLERMRKFYTSFSLKNSATMLRKLKKKNSATVLRNFETIESSIVEFKQLYKLSWSHYILLLKIEYENERSFYEIEAEENNWSVRELQRQYNSSLYERIALSKKGKDTHNMLEQRKSISNPIEFLKEPYVLEFLELKDDASFTESQLEEAIINKIEKFLMELGKGFLFDSRQKRISFDGDDFYIDLVFYNRLLKCFVLIDLKIGKLTHQDIGQLQMYVNYYDRKIKTKDENKTIGIILCKQTNKAVVEFTLPEDNKQIFAREYKLYLPSKSDLQKLLQD